MKFEVLKEFAVMNGGDKKTMRAGKAADSRDVGLTEKSMAELQRGGFIHVEKGQADAPVNANPKKEVK
jgi:hypothetical protein